MASSKPSPLAFSLVTLGCYERPIHSTTPGLLLVGSGWFPPSELPLTNEPTITGSLEIIVGYSVGSLALVADSFHMLNDVMSLIVALYALKLAEDTTRSNKYSYGWQRAEILGALINGVFLLALCFSIFLEAIERMFGSPEVGSPRLVVVVGTLGLLSNIVGLFLFQEHGYGGHSHGGSGGHSHGGQSDSQGHDGQSAAEEGHSHSHRQGKKDKNAPVNKSKGNGRAAGGTKSYATAVKSKGSSNAGPTERSPLLPASSVPRTMQNSSGAGSGAETPFEDEEPSDMLEELLVHPARTREAIVRQAYDAGFGLPRRESDSGTGGLGHRRTLSVQSQGRRTGGNSRKAIVSPSSERSEGNANGDENTHEENAPSHEHGEEDENDPEHDHEQEEGGRGPGTSNGNMNMQGVFLHVLGDAVSLASGLCCVSGVLIRPRLPARQRRCYRCWLGDLAYTITLSFLRGPNHLLHHYCHYLLICSTLVPERVLHTATRHTVARPTRESAICDSAGTKRDERA